MSISYKLTKDLVGRAAAQLSWKLSEINSGVSIAKTKIINGKSLVGVLSGHFRFNDIVTVTFDNAEEVEAIKEIFTEVGDINE